MVLLAAAFGHELCPDPKGSAKAARLALVDFLGPLILAAGAVRIPPPR